MKKELMAQMKVEYDRVHDKKLLNAERSRKGHFRIAPSLYQPNKIKIHQLMTQMLGKIWKGGLKRLLKHLNSTLLHVSVSLQVA
jgi:hypothetical protein